MITSFLDNSDLNQVEEKTTITSLSGSHVIMLNRKKALENKNDKN